MLVLKFMAFIYGAFIGSFLNVLIHRIPRKMSFITPRSRCPKCGKKIHWYENIPVISFLFLKQQCPQCKSKISFRYPLIEILTGTYAFIFFPSIQSVPLLVDYVFFFIIFCILLVHFFIDLDFQILPDGLNLVLGVLILSYTIMFNPWKHWAFGGLVGFFFPLGITYLFYLLKGKVGLGGGDIKLYGILGLLFGPVGIVNTITFSCLLGSLFGIYLLATKKIKRDQPLAFGPFIIIIALVQIHFPDLLSLSFSAR